MDDQIMLVQQTVTTWVETEVFYGYKFKDLDHFIFFLNKLIDIRPEPTGKEILTHYFKSNEDLRSIINDKSNYIGNKYYAVNIALINLNFTFESLQMFITKQNGIDYNYYIKPWDWNPDTETGDESFVKTMFSDNSTDLDFVKSPPKLPDEFVELVKSIDETILSDFKFHLNIYETTKEEY